MDLSPLPRGALEAGGVHPVLSKGGQDQPALKRFFVEVGSLGGALGLPEGA
jgi:hypothetical protein